MVNRYNTFCVNAVFFCLSEVQKGDTKYPAACCAGILMSCQLAAGYLIFIHGIGYLLYFSVR